MWSFFGSLLLCLIVAAQRTVSQDVNVAMPGPAPKPAPKPTPAPPMPTPAPTRTVTAEEHIFAFIVPGLTGRPGAAELNELRDASLEFLDQVFTTALGTATSDFQYTGVDGRIVRAEYDAGIPTNAYNLLWELEVDVSFRNIQGNQNLPTPLELYNIIKQSNLVTYVTNFVRRVNSLSTAIAPAFLERVFSPTSAPVPRPTPIPTPVPTPAPSEPRSKFCGESTITCNGGMSENQPGELFYSYRRNMECVEKCLWAFRNLFSRIGWQCGSCPN